MLPLALLVHVHDVSSAVVALVGVLALTLAGVGFAALRRSGNRGLIFVSLAFLVFGAKGLFAAWAIRSRAVAHEDLELLLSLADLVVVVLLVVPLLRSRESAAA